MVLWTEDSLSNRAERHDAVLRVMADVRAAAVRDARTAAPVGDDRLLVGGESGVVGEDVADPPEPDPRRAPDVRARGHMEHRAVDAVELLADVLDHEVDAG